MQDKFYGKVAAINLILPVVFSLVIAGVGAAIGLQLMGDVKADMTASSAEANATQNAIEGVANITNKFPILGTAIVLGIIIAVLVGFVYYKSGGGM